MDKPRIVLVGRRKAAVAAARALGFDVVQIAHKARAEQTRLAYGGGPQEAIAAARSALGDERPAAVVAVAEGAVPSAAAIRDHYGLSGLSSRAAAGCHDKLVMKRALAGAGVRCAAWLEVTAETSARDLVFGLGLPLVLKIPVSSGGRGVHIAHSLADVVDLARPGMLAEGFVHGVEMSVETLLAGGRPVFRNPTCYLEPRWANLLPAPRQPQVLEQAFALIDRAHQALGVGGGITHSELFLTPDGPVFSELAARPPGGFIMKLLALAYDFDPWQAVLELELGREPALPQRAARYAAVRVLHPGAGTVAEVRGVEEARAISGVHSVSIRVAPGKAIGPREGSGQSVGHIIAVDDDADRCARSLAEATRAIEIALDDSGAP